MVSGDSDDANNKSDVAWAEEPDLSGLPRSRDELIARLKQYKKPEHKDSMLPQRMSKLEENYGFRIKYANGNFVLLSNEDGFDSKPIKPVYTFRSLTSKKTKQDLENLTGAPTIVVEQELASLALEHGPQRKREDTFRIVAHEESGNQKEPTVLEHLSLIEDPAVANLPVAVECVISSTSISYLVPKTVEAFVIDKNGNEDSRTIPIGEKNPINIKLVGVNEDIKYKRLKRFVEEAVNEPGSKIRMVEKEWRTIYRIRVRPPVFTLEKREGKLVDEKGFEYKSYDVYVCADKSITFEASSLVRLKGIVLPSPQNQNTTLLVYELEFPEEIRDFDTEKLDRLRASFSGLGVQGRTDWILSEFEKFSRVMGRRNVAFAGLAAFFTPLYIKFDGKTERGFANVTVFGDTTTGKSETVKKLILLLKAGMLITAETASAVGLVGAAIQSEKGQWSVEWGFLVLNDRKLLAVDGAHKLPSDQWAALAESERSGTVVIAKAAKNSAYARTRQIKIANPKDQEANQFSTKAMKDFLYAVQTLPTVYDKTEIARIDLAAFADSRDVKIQDVNQQRSLDYDSNLDLMADVLRWCWSYKASVEFTPEAVKEILDAATELHGNFFSDAVPLASIDMKFKLARLCAALAFMTLSTEDYKTVSVTKEHVEAVSRFIETEYSNAGLSILAQEDKYETVTLEDAEIFITNIAYRVNIDRDKAVEILRFIVLQGRVTKAILMEKFDLVEKNQFRPLVGFLESEKLLRGGRGYYSTSKLIETYKILPSLPSLPLPEKDSPGKTCVHTENTQQTISSPSYSGDGKQGKRGKNTIESALDAQREKAGTPGTVKEKEKICGHCVNWHKPGCSYPDTDPYCAALTNRHAIDCRDYLPEEACKE